MALADTSGLQGERIEVRSPSVQWMWHIRLLFLRSCSYN
jgi:hypothetical protein